MEIEGDFISALPDDVIVCILSHDLPIDSIVRTSTLSKRWRHLWKFVPVINFPYSLLESKIETTSLFARVDQCLSLYKAQKIRDFVVVAEWVESSTPEPNVGKWVEFAISRHVESCEVYLKMHGYKRETYFKMPDSLYIQKNTQSLQNLALTGVEFMVPPSIRGAFTGFVSLKKLFLNECSLSDDGLGLIMSNCGLLESLGLICCAGFLNPRVSSMVLKEFIFHRYLDSEETLLEIDAPNLISVDCSNMITVARFSKSCHPRRVVIDDMSYRFSIEQLTHWIFQLSQVEFLGTVLSCFQFLEFALDFNGGPSTTLKNVREFYYIASSICTRMALVLFGFIKACPCLSKIQIELLPLKFPPQLLRRFPPRSSKIRRRFRISNDYFPLDEREKERLPKVGPIYQLKTMELFYCIDDAYVIEFIKLILEQAVNLEKVVLFFEDAGQSVMKSLTHLIIPTHVQKEVLRRLSRLPRASPHVVFFLA